jgi:hypothetical protein
VVKKFLYLVPSANVRLHRHRFSGKTRWRRTNVGCAKSIRSKIGNTDAWVQKTKTVRNVQVNSVITELSPRKDLMVNGPTYVGLNFVHGRFN